MCRLPLFSIRLDFMRKPRCQCVQQDAAEAASAIFSAAARELKPHLKLNKRMNLAVCVLLWSSTAPHMKSWWSSRADSGETPAAPLEKSYSCSLPSHFIKTFLCADRRLARTLALSKTAQSFCIFWYSNMDIWICSSIPLNSSASCLFVHIVCL